MDLTSAQSVSLIEQWFAKLQQSPSAATREALAANIAKATCQLMMIDEHLLVCALIAANNQKRSALTTCSFRAGVSMYTIQTLEVPLLMTRRVNALEMG
jgi:hypothetical protein